MSMISMSSICRSYKESLDTRKVLFSCRKSKFQSFYPFSPVVPNSHKNYGFVVNNLKPKKQRKESLVSNLLFEIFDVLISNCKGRTFRIFDDMFKALDVDGTGFIDLEYLSKLDSNGLERMNSDEQFEGRKMCYTEFLIS